MICSVTGQSHCADDLTAVVKPVRIAACATEEAWQAVECRRPRTDYPAIRRISLGAVRQKPRLRVAGKFMLRILGLFNPFLREVVEMHYLVDHSRETRRHSIVPTAAKSA